MGSQRFQNQLATFNVEVSEKDATNIISTYRATYNAIPKLWTAADRMLHRLLTNRTAYLGRGKLITAHPDKGLLLPNGLYLRYPNLRVEDDELVYDSKRSSAGGASKVHLYGGKVIENVCQALARIIIGEQMLMISRKYKVALTVHDAICVVVPEAEADEALEYVTRCMKTAPDWAEGLPLNCEAGSHRSYGLC
jgi:DNA polymerase